MKLIPYSVNNSPVASRKPLSQGSSNLYAKTAKPHPADSWQGASVSQTLSTTPARPSSPVKFGMIHPYCGVCPICVAGAAAQKELDAIRRLREGKDQTEDLKVSVGEGMNNIRRQGRETGAAVERSNIGNEDGTRIQQFSQKDKDIFHLAALPRLYHPDGKTYQVNVDPLKAGKGTENGLFKLLTGGADSKAQTEAYDTSEGAAPPPILEGLLNKIGKQVRSFGIYHHISEGLEVRTTSQSKPLLVGYASMLQLQPKELLVPSIRALPRMENGGVEPGGLMNALGMAAKSKNIDSVALFVEPWQKELQDYIKVLQQRYKLPIQELAPQQVPEAYQEFKNTLNFPNGAAVVRIPVQALKNSLNQIDPSAPVGQRDTEMLQTIALPDPEKEAKAAHKPTGATYTWKRLPMSQINLRSPLPNIPGLTIPDIPPSPALNTQDHR